MTAPSANSPACAQLAVGSGAGEAAASAPQRTATKTAGVPGHMSKATTTERKGRLLSRWGRHCGEWDADEVAAHLMECRAQVVRGLARKTPWAGLDDETLDSCFGHAAAVIVKVAASGQRPEWRTPRDLEKAQIAAYRHQAFDHWKRANAQSRQSDRYAIAFDPDRHASDHTPIDRLFDQPDLHTIERDLLAELADDRLRAFWTIVLREQAPFKTAGDRLGLSKPAVMACTRRGRAAFANYLDRRADGELCRDRSSDIAASLAGTAPPWRIERAEAHLESCYACALIHEPGTSAIERGILGIAPTGLILRLLSRAGDAASVPAMRIAESGSGTRAVAAGLAALSVAGTGVAVQERAQQSQTTLEQGSSTAPTAPARRAAPLRRPAAPAAGTLGARRSAPPAVSATRRGQAARRITRKRPESTRRRKTPGRRVDNAVLPPRGEFDLEISGRSITPPPPPPSAARRTNAPNLEFPTP